VPYRIDLTPAAARQFRMLPPDQKDRIRRRIDQLGSDPRPSGCEKIAGAASLWRVRIGDYRIVYEVRDDRLVVIVVLIGNRRDIYDALRNL
jgi:mRNA interferase RelE/StbE